MRIDLNPRAQELPDESNRTNSASQPAKVSPSALSSAPEDQAQLSSVHAQIPVLVAQALQLPEVREEKVTALRQAVQSGNYQPQADQISEALIFHMLMDPAA